MTTGPFLLCEQNPAPERQVSQEQAPSLFAEGIRPSVLRMPRPELLVRLYLFHRARSMVMSLPSPLRAFHGSQKRLVWLRAEQCNRVFWVFKLLLAQRQQSRTKIKQKAKK